MPVLVRPSSAWVEVAGCGRVMHLLVCQEVRNADSEVALARMVACCYSCRSCPLAQSGRVTTRSIRGRCTTLESPGGTLSSSRWSVPGHCPHFSCGKNTHFNPYFFQNPHHAGSLDDSANILPPPLDRLSQPSPGNVLLLHTPNYNNQPQHPNNPPLVPSPRFA